MESSSSVAEAIAVLNDCGHQQELIDLMHQGERGRERDHRPKVNRKPAASRTSRIAFWYSTVDPVARDIFCRRIRF